MKYIYGLVDPRTRGVRYIGQTDDLARRLQQHLQEKENTAKGEWIRALRDQSLAPTIIQLDAVNGEESPHHVEYRWIYFGRKSGWELTNTTGMKSEEYYSLQGYFEKLIVEMERPEGVISREYSMADVKQGLLKNVVLLLDVIPGVWRAFSSVIQGVARSKPLAVAFNFLATITYIVFLFSVGSKYPSSDDLPAVLLPFAAIGFVGGVFCVIMTIGLAVDEDIPSPAVSAIGVIFVGLTILAQWFL